MESISYQRFRNRIEQLEQHMEAVDLCINVTLAIAKATTNVQLLAALPTQKNAYKQLNHPVNQASRIFNFSKSLNFELALISLYRYFGEYLKGLLTEMYVKDPLAIVGKAQGVTLAYHDIITLGSFPAISTKMIDTVFRRLEEERSTLKLLDKILSHTKIALTQNTKDVALHFLEMRHLFIHNNGQCDSSFEKNHGAYFNIKAGADLPTDYKTASAAVSSVAALLKEIDQHLLVAKLIPPRV